MYYEKKVDRRSRTAMAAFLAGHIRYNTMNSWNASTSYAQCIKLHRIGLNQEQMNSAYEILDADYWRRIDSPIAVFNAAWNGHYTIGVNGRSGGYLVLYQSAYESTGVIETGKLSIYPGRSIDQHEDFDDWEMEDLRSRVQLVSEFDRTCDAIRDEFIDPLTGCRVRKKTVMMPKTVYAIECRE